MSGLKERMIKNNRDSLAAQQILEEGGIGHEDRQKRRKSGKSRTKNNGGKPTTKR